jgi:hypothetical protein
VADVARILSARPLLYDEGADAALDRPAHVRAASGITWAQTPEGERLVVCQDDAAFIGLLEPRTGRVRARALPAGPGGFRQFGKARNNKMDKLDLEAACMVPSPGGPRAWLLGSGSAPVREVIVEVDVARAEGAVRVCPVPALFAALRAHDALAGAELNLEGACVVGADLVLLQRGNGAGGVNAVARVALEEARALAEGRPAALTSLRVDRVELPLSDGVPLTFTDAERVTFAGGDAVLFLAAAEASPNAIDDGEVVGCALGVLVLTPAPCVVAWAPIVEADGTKSVRKPEGIALEPSVRGRAWLVVDMDDERAPSQLCEVELPTALAGVYS